MALFLNPDITYLLLLLGLWAAVTAIYVPGTGVAESVGLVALAGGGYLLLQLPTNWWAVLILVVGVGAFLALPVFGPKVARYAEAGLVFQAVGAFFLFSGLNVNPILLILTIGLSLLYHRFVLLRLMDAQEDDPETGDVHLVGSRGRVVARIDPAGTVNVDGELWTARSDEALESGLEIVVVRRDGLQVFVLPADKRKRVSGEATLEEGA